MSSVTSARDGDGDGEHPLMMVMLKEMMLMLMLPPMLMLMALSFTAIWEAHPLLRNPLNSCAERLDPSEHEART